MSYRFSCASKRRLLDAHPDLARVAERALLLSPHDFAVTESVRTIERQTELQAKGFSKTLHSMHLRQIDGYAHAIDVIAVGDLNGDGTVDHKDMTLTWNPELYAEIAAAFKEAAQNLGVSIRWGGDFKTRDGDPFFDGPHFELVDAA